MLEGIADGTLEILGTDVGLLVGLAVGELLGELLGLEVGLLLGDTEGLLVGFELGLEVGLWVGLLLGELLGDTEGLDVGLLLGELLGLDVGPLLGPNEGLTVGSFAFGSKPLATSHPSVNPSPSVSLKNKLVLCTFISSPSLKPSPSVSELVALEPMEFSYVSDRPSLSVSSMIGEVDGLGVLGESLGYIYISGCAESQKRENERLV